MRKQYQFLQLSDEHLSSLTILLAKGNLNARVARRATALLQLHQGLNLNVIAQCLGVVYQTVADWRDKYFQTGLDFLRDKERPGRPIVFDGSIRAKVTALACSSAPDGYATWSLRLLADRLVELDYCESISHSQVQHILKKNGCSHI